MQADPYTDREALAGLDANLPSLPSLAALHVGERALDGLTSIALILVCAVLVLLMAGCTAQAEPEPAVEVVPAVRVPTCETYATRPQCRRVMTAINDGGMRT